MRGAKEKDLMKRASLLVQVIKTLSRMSTLSVRPSGNGERQKAAYLDFLLWLIDRLNVIDWNLFLGPPIYFVLFSKHLKNTTNYFLLQWECSSAGEHMTEDHGVPGSNPGTPIWVCLSRKTFINNLKLKLTS